MTEPIPGFVDRLTAPPSTRNLTRRAWSSFERWCYTFGLCPTRPDAAVLVLYLMQRASGEWAPPRGKQKGLKRKGIDSLRNSIIRAWDWAGHDVKAIRKSRPLSHFMSNLRVHNHISQNVTDSAMPFTEDELRALLASLVDLVRRGWVNHLWAACWKAKILIGVAGGFRISELIRMEKPWLHLVQDDEGPLLLVVVPKAKNQNEPKTVKIRPRSDDLCPLAALLAWFDAAATTPDGLGLSKVFPSVSKLAPRPATPPPPTSVRGMCLNDFPHLVAELSEDVDPATIRAGSNLKLRWKCDAGHEWAASIHNRTGQGTGCPVCCHGRAGGQLTDHKGQPRQIIDGVADRLDDPEFRPHEDSGLRTHSALSLVVDGAIKQFKALCADAGIECGEDERLTSHALRKTTGTQMANDGHALAAISRHLRHANEVATLPYVVDGHLTAPPITAEIPDW